MNAMIDTFWTDDDDSTPKLSWQSASGNVVKLKLSVGSVALKWTAAASLDPISLLYQLTYIHTDAPKVSILYTLLLLWQANYFSRAALSTLLPSDLISYLVSWMEVSCVWFYSVPFVYWVVYLWRKCNTAVTIAAAGWLSWDSLLILWFRSMERASRCCYYMTWRRAYIKDKSLCELIP